MKTKDFLLVAVGLGLGYFLFKKNPFKKKTDLEQITSDVKEIVEDTKDTVMSTIDSVKKAECEKKWNNYSSLIRPSSEEALNKMREEYINSCLSTK